jgi:hypothetical protein
MLAPLCGFRVTVPSRRVVEIVVLTHILTARRISAMPDWTRKKLENPSMLHLLLRFVHENLTVFFSRSDALMPGRA